MDRPQKRPRHPAVLREAQATAPGRAAARLGRTVQRSLHSRIMQAAREARTTDPGWDGGDPPEDEQDVA